MAEARAQTFGEFRVDQVKRLVEDLGYIAEDHALEWARYMDAVPADASLDPVEGDPHHIMWRCPDPIDKHNIYERAAPVAYKESQHLKKIHLNLTDLIAMVKDRVMTVRGLRTIDTIKVNLSDGIKQYKPFAEVIVITDWGASGYAGIAQTLTGALMIAGARAYWDCQRAPIKNPTRMIVEQLDRRQMQELHYKHYGKGKRRVCLWD